MLDTFNSISVQTQQNDLYDVWVGEGIFEQAISNITERVSSSQACVIIDERVLELHGDFIRTVLKAKYNSIHFHSVPSGEQSKSTEEFNRAVDFLLNVGVSRKTPVIAIGGGVTGDLAGYVASSVMRGLPLIHVPTTLLAMVDSSIGGKTGINHSTGKNLIGAFYQPKMVISDVRFLETLDKKEWANGLSEIIKYAAIRSPQIYEHIASLIQSNSVYTPSEWISLIKESASIKIDVVQEDVLESGVREYLNFGHTFAHAIENYTGYHTFSHGEAVFAGMFAAVHASNTLGANIDIDTFRAFKPLYDFSVHSLEGNIDDLVELMRRDKKVKDGQIRLVLLKDHGQPFVQPISDVDVIRNAWKFMISEFK